MWTSIVLIVLMVLGDGWEVVVFHHTLGLTDPRPPFRR